MIPGDFTERLISRSLLICFNYTAYQTSPLTRQLSQAKLPLYSFSCVECSLVFYLTHTLLRHMYIAKSFSRFYYYCILYLFDVLLLVRQYISMQKYILINLSIAIESRSIKYKRNVSRRVIKLLSKPIKTKPLNMNVHLVLIKTRINHNFAIRFTEDYIIRRSMIERENHYLGKERFNIRDTLSANKSLKRTSRRRG